jgi:menaquinone-dependent protoporphyrinogen oxidase
VWSDISIEQGPSPLGSMRAKRHDDLMTKILVAYHSGEGQTTKIAEHIGTVLHGLGVDAEVCDAADAPPPGGFDAVVVGDSIHLGRHSRSLTGYLRRHHAALDESPLALFQVSMTSARDDAAHAAEADKHVQKLLERTAVHPELIVTFAGALKYAEYGWVTKRVMRSIARREGNATDMSRDHEYTDWSAVDDFANDGAVLAVTKATR